MSLPGRRGCSQRSHLLRRPARRYRSATCLRARAPTPHACELQWILTRNPREVS